MIPNMNGFVNQLLRYHATYFSNSPRKCMCISLHISFILCFQDTSIDVQGLYENNQYLFRVSALNSIGQSKPLEAEGPIIAKMPFGKLKSF